MEQKILIVGGVAGGASAAARLRRLDEKAKIILFERGPDISYANCGLPYHIGGSIKEEDRLLLQTPEAMKARFNIDVRVENEVLSVDAQHKTVKARDLSTGREYEESYDALILSPGARPFVPPLPGANLPGVFTLRNVPDTKAIINYIHEKNVRNAVVVGGGFIGVEMAENLAEKGVAVTLLEGMDQVLPPLDPEMAAMVQNCLRSNKISVTLNKMLSEIKQTGDSLEVTAGDIRFTADMVLLSIGVRPEVDLAKSAGLKLGERGGIWVDGHQRTSDPSIYAVGDATETLDIISQKNTLLALAGPANRQGRMAADNISGLDESFKGVAGTSILKIFNLTAACTGHNEKQLKKDGVAYEKIYIHPMSHASYYPGGSPMTLKLIFSPETRKILGAQAVGTSGVDKRIDVLATALQFGGTVDQLEQLELSYAPPYSSAKDPVNMAGFVAVNVLEGRTDIIHWHDIDLLDDSTLVLDVRTPEEYELGHIGNAQLYPVDRLREKVSELPRDRDIVVYCKVGIRGYIAERILKANGFNRVRNLSGGYDLYHALHAQEVEKNSPINCLGYASRGQEATEKANAIPQADTTMNGEPVSTIQLDACGLQCPGPILRLSEGIKSIKPGDVLRITATDPAFGQDVETWCRHTGNRILSQKKDNDVFEYCIQKGEPQTAPANSGAERPHDKTMVVFSGDLDKAIAAFIIANGAASMGRKVTMFFTFWGLNILRKSERVRIKKKFIPRMFGMMMPRGTQKLRLSRMSMGGIGGKMIRGIMKKNNVSSLEELIQTALQNGVRIVACSMSMDLMGLDRQEFIEGIEIGGVATFLGSAEDSDATLFI